MHGREAVIRLNHQPAVASRGVQAAETFLARAAAGQAAWNTSNLAEQAAKIGAAATTLPLYHATACVYNIEALRLGNGLTTNSEQWTPSPAHAANWCWDV